MTTVANNHKKQDSRGQGFSACCQLISGDFFKFVPAAGNRYIMRAIIHGKSDKMTIQWLVRCKYVMLADGRLLLLELEMQ